MDKTKAYTAAKNTLIVLVIARNEVESGDIRHAATLIGQMVSDRASLLSAEGCVSLVFTGYEADPRALHSIPELRAWFQALTKERPYWSFLANRIDDSVGVIMALLLPGKQEQGNFPGQLGWRFEMSGLRPLLIKLFAGQNRLVEHFGISETDNARISNDFIEAVSASID